MPKVDAGFNSAEYALVADRITNFYERYPTGRIVTELVSRIERGGGAFEITFRARVYRAADDVHAAATGYASEREDDGDINAVACVENTETSAIGRALANLGFTASLRRSSYEEMQKAARARVRLATAEGERTNVTTQLRESGDSTNATLQHSADRVLAVLDLLAEAERGGLALEKSAPIRDRLTAPTVSLAYAERTERQLRRWLVQRSTDDAGHDSASSTDRS